MSDQRGAVEILHKHTHHAVLGGQEIFSGQRPEVPVNRIPRGEDLAAQHLEDGVGAILAPDRVPAASGVRHFNDPLHGADSTPAEEYGHPRGLPTLPEVGLILVVFGVIGFFLGYFGI